VNAAVPRLPLLIEDASRPASEEVSEWILVVIPLLLLLRVCVNQLCKQFSKHIVVVADWKIYDCTPLLGK